jgi:glycosyltransferase involved in cell wall biosynthesis
MSAAADQELVVAVIPMYDEQATIRAVVDATCCQVDAVVVVDDGSGDASLARLADAPVHVIRHEANRGKGESLRRGFRAALELGASAVVPLDADGEHPPDAIGSLRTAHRTEPAALVIAARDDAAGNAPRLRRGANRTADFFVSWAAGLRLRDTQSGFRLYPAALARRLCDGRGEGFAFESEALMEAVARGHEVRYVHIPALYDDLARPSHYRPLRDSLAIARMVALRLLRRGLSPRRLLRSHRSGSPPST